jgi:O-antigen/teichoic acid export membrane protein
MSLFVIASGRNPFARIVLLNGAVSILAVSALTPRFGMAGAATGQMLATLFVSGWFNSLEFAKTIRGLKRGVDGGEV